MNAAPPSLLAISGKHHAQLANHLYPGDGKEAVALALCGQSHGARRHQLLVQEIVLVPYAACRIRTPNRVTWSVESVLPALERAMAQGLSVVKFHSHPQGFAEFSAYDDESDRAFFEAVDGYLDTAQPQASVVMLPDGNYFGRLVHRGVLGASIDEFRVAGDDFRFMTAENGVPSSVPDHALRIVQTFGDGTYSALRSLRIGVVGCSGTGSLVLEQLARNCVGELVIVDPKPVGLKNLNRIPNSTYEDAQLGRQKTAVLSRAIDAMGLGTKVYAYKADIFSRDVILALADCDILFGCLDSVDGRHILNKIASQFLIPYIDLGVRIDADGHGGIDQACGAVHTLQPGGSSLLSRRVYSSDDLNAAFMARHEPARYAEMKKLGYVKGADVERPAVISLNMLTAAVAVNEMLARLLPFRVDPNSCFAQRRISLSDPSTSEDQGDGEACHVFTKLVGRGAAKPLLGYPQLEISENA